MDVTINVWRLKNGRHFLLMIYEKIVLTRHNFGKQEKHSQAFHFITDDKVSIITLVTKITNNNICSICDEEFSEMIRRMIEMSIQPFLGIILQQLLSLMITKLSQKDILCILYFMVVLIQTMTLWFWRLWC